MSAGRATREGEGDGMPPAPLVVLGCGFTGTGRTWSEAYAAYLVENRSATRPVELEGGRKDALYATFQGLGFSPPQLYLQDFDANSGTWTMIKKFDSGTNGNGNTWTQYSLNFNSGSATQISVGHKLGLSSGSGPTILWDTLRVQ